MSVIAPVVPAAAAVPPKRTRFRWLRVGSILAGCWLVVVVLGAALAPLIAPYNPEQQDLTAILQGPTLQHLLGTDTLGRDILSRLMFGAPTTLISIAIAAALYAVLGTVSGLIAGYYVGWTDRATIAILTIVISVPGITIMFAVLSVYRNNTYLAMAIFGFLTAPIMALLVRASVLSMRNELFIDAARVSGLSDVHIIFRHVLPRIKTLVIVQTSLFAANAVVLESAITFLGFGRQPPLPTWGNMVSEAASQISLNPWMLYPTGGVIFFTALALGVLGDDVGASVSHGWTGSKITGPAPRTATRSATVPSSALLTVDDLSVGYRTDDGVRQVVRHVTFELRRGRTLGLVGESGSGKTTVALGVLGLTGQGMEISSGRVVFDGTDISRLGDAGISAIRGKRIGYVAQEPTVALDPNLTVGSQLNEAIARNDPNAFRRGSSARAIELLTRVEIRDPASAYTKYPHQLSGGMAQRVSIAFALAGNPELLIADEPTTALDVTVQAGILSLLLRLRDEIGMSMLLITHDWGVIADVCDEVAVMYRGVLVEQGDAADIFHHPRHPYTRALLAANPHTAKPGEDLPVIAEEFAVDPVPSVVSSGVSDE